MVTVLFLPERDRWRVTEFVLSHLQTVSTGPPEPDRKSAANLSNEQT